VDFSSFSLVVELAGIAFVVLLVVRHFRMNKKRPLDRVMSIHGFHEKDLEKIPEKTRNAWSKRGVSYQEFSDEYRFHVENNI
jgi:hypothetical protein